MGKGDGRRVPGNPYEELGRFGGFGPPLLIEGEDVARPERQRVTPEARAYLVKTFGPQFKNIHRFLMGQPEEIRLPEANLDARGMLLYSLAPPRTYAKRDRDGRVRMIGPESGR